MQLLRNLGDMTRLLILRETSTRHHAVQRTIADALGMTVQGASEYLRSMERERLIQVVDGEYRPTIEGIRVLHERFRELREFVNQTSRDLAIIEVTAAFAGNRIDRGQRVGLFMEGGDLVAYSGRDSPSTGRAAEAADKGVDLPVTNLQGIVDLHPGRITLLRMPAIADGGSRAVESLRVRKALRRSRADVIAALDVPAKALAERVRLRLDIWLGVIPSVIEAAERGLSVAVIVPEDRVASVVAAIEDANERLVDKIAYQTVPIA